MKKGTLYLVATPIGNLQDITLRAINTLKEVELIAAEDTRQTIKLLNHFEIKKPMVSYYEHNKIVKGNYLIEQLQQGKDIALVSDAGTPGISDPGEDLVRLCIENEITVTMIPGPVAAVTGMVISGLPTGRFVFEGFLPMNKRTRQERLKQLKDETRTIIFYEAPHKLPYTLKDMYNAWGERRIALARELTKRYEEVIRCNLSEAAERYQVETPKGEFVVVIEGQDQEVLQELERDKYSDISIEEHVERYVKEGLPKKEAVKRAAEDRGLNKRDVYNLVMKK
ncbi:16S rRNA (cytidine(1402)-2'-O)-methyltransferase [Ruminiclostridium cellobioparum]|uniref:Ribosomal RNA small subunit methyltransferase I n=1 Tax=Ruminiclostridium cellobioparum subsp. termitidis CT1112 TaxID=1195236 RepID=S0FYE6_RUMCE|nr:16S rRNA (cytidine(1402)-2'-O)-methyltransferase [Ruminiclostridium cellobioparum]EMS73618.1 putative S-adenosylmethionine-dependent methyltransferase, YraL family [Ruminiclostridium cellobioparum subsp. termitidis CT1112]